MKPTVVSSSGLAALSLFVAILRPDAAGATATDGNSFRSPIASALADRVVSEVLGRPTSPLPECSADSGLASGQRVLYNDVLVEGSRGAAAIPGLGANCHVSFIAEAGGGPIRVTSTVSFSDAWGPSFSSNGTAAFTTASGKVMRVAQISLMAILSVSKYRRFEVVAVPFHDKHYAFILLTGSGLDEKTARAYTSGTVFKARKGFEMASVDLAMPKLNFKATSYGCDSPCLNLRLSRSVNVFLDEYGSGDGSYLPSASSKLNMIPTTYPGNTFGAKVKVRVGQPYYFAIVDVDRQSVLMDAFIAHP